MKLPDIQYGGVTQANLVGPSADVNQSQQRIALVNQAQAGAKEIVDTRRKYVLTKTRAEYADRMSAFRQEAARESTVGRDKIIAWGLEGELDIDAQDSFTKAEWYPKLLDRVQQETLQEYAEKIGSPIDRNTFYQDVNAENNMVMEREIALAQAESIAEMKRMALVEAEAAAMQGNWQTARELINASDLTPAEKQEQTGKITSMEQSDQVRDQMQVLIDAESVSGLREMADYLRSDDANKAYSHLSAKELDAAAKTADGIAKVTENAAKTNAIDYEKATLNNYWAEYGDDPVALVANLPALHAALPEGIPPTEYRAINNYADKRSKGQPITLDIEAYQQLSDMAREEPERFANENLSRYRDKIPSTELKAFINQQAELRDIYDGKVDSTGYDSNKDVINTALVNSGIPISGNSKVEQRMLLQQLITSEFTNAVAAKGGPLTLAEKKQVAKEVTQFSYEKPSTFFRSGTTEEVAMPFKKMDEEEIVQSTAAIAETGLPVTAENVYYYNQLIDQDIPITKLNLDVAALLIRDKRVVTAQSVARYIEQLKANGYL